MKYIMVVIGLLMAVAQSEASSETYDNKSHNSYSHLYKHHRHVHSKHSCGEENPIPPGPVCTEDERIINGDFESDPVTNSSQVQLLTSLTGWDIEWTNGGCFTSVPLAELYSFPWEQLEGSTQYIELDPHYQNASHCSNKTNIQISQDIEAQVGEILKLEFNYKPRSLTNGKMELKVNFGYNNVEVGTFTSTDWKKFSKEYKVTRNDLKNGKMNLSIKDIGNPNNYGMRLDNVSVKSISCDSNPAPDFAGQFYYIDNSSRKIYKGAVQGSDVILKEWMNSPYRSAHIGQLNFETLVVVESAGNKRIKQIDIFTKEAIDSGRFDFLGTLGQAFAFEDYVLVNQEGTNKIYNQNLETNETSLMGTVMYNQQPLILKGGDLFQGLTNVLYMVTNKDGGSLYSLESDPSNYAILNATLIVKNLGSVTGLAQLPSGELIVSLRYSTVMKVVDAYRKTVRIVNLKGDLKKQGSKGGDLAGFDTL